MSESPLPVEGWAQKWTSYRSHIVRAVVALMRDHGPVDAKRVCSEIKRVGTGGDVAKASPDHHVHDGAQRILNLLLTDLEVITVTDDGRYVVDPLVREARSAMFDQTFPVPSADEADEQRARFARETQLRRWVSLHPFQGEWRDGLRVHDEADVIALADEMAAIGYVGDPIVRDQFGVTINGHLREQALRKLGRDPDRYAQVVHFRSDLHRLAYIYAAHRNAKGFPPALRKAMEKMIRKGRARARDQGEIVWPDDLRGIFGDQDTPVESARPVQQVIQEPAKHDPSMATTVTIPTDTDTGVIGSPASPEDMLILSHYLDGALSDHELAVLIGDDYNKTNPKVSRCVQAGLLTKIGRHSDGSRIMELTAAGREQATVGVERAVASSGRARR